MTEIHDLPIYGEAVESAYAIVGTIPGFDDDAADRVVGDIAYVEATSRLGSPAVAVATARRFADESIITAVRSLFRTLADDIAAEYGI